MRFEKQTDKSILEWLNHKVIDPLPANLAHEHFLLMHPRVSFLKNLPYSSTVLDIGAGDGQLKNFRNWLGFERLDLKFIGISLEHGSQTIDYDEFHLCNLDYEKPRLKLKPSHAVAAQFIEHIDKPIAFFEWLSSVIPVGGSAFIDWPSAHTKDLPSRDLIISAGFDITTLNFFDDATHKNAFEINDVISMAKSVGFESLSSGFISMPYLAESLKFHGIAEKNQYLLSMAVWLKTYFTSYVIFYKV